MEDFHEIGRDLLNISQPNVNDIGRGRPAAARTPMLHDADQLSDHLDQRHRGRDLRVHFGPLDLAGGSRRCPPTACEMAPETGAQSPRRALYRPPSEAHSENGLLNFAFNHGLMDRMEMGKKQQAKIAPLWTTRAVLPHYSSTTRLQMAPETGLAPVNAPVYWVLRAVYWVSETTQALPFYYLELLVHYRLLTLLLTVDAAVDAGDAGEGRFRNHRPN